MNLIVILSSVLVGLISISLIFIKLYKKATKERSFIRTGLGGEKVVLDGGALVFPIFQEKLDINMTTMKLNVERSDNQSLITKDRLRVNVLVEFFIKVQQTKEGVSNAARTLGAKTLEPSKVKELLEGKFTDAMRSVAAQMNMSEMHEKRSDFILNVQKNLTEDLGKNGLELESVSLTNLDQTKKEFFSQDNIFDAQGLEELTKSVEDRRKKVNDIEKDTKLLTETKNLETEKQLLEIEKQKANYQLEQEALIAQKKSEQESLIENTKIEKNRDIEFKRIETEKEIKEKEIEQKVYLFKKQEEELTAKIDLNKKAQEEIVTLENIQTQKEIEIKQREQKVNKIEQDTLAETEIIIQKNKAEALKIFTDNESANKKTIAQAEADSIEIVNAALEKKYQVEAKGRQLEVEAENSQSPEILQFMLLKTLLEKLPEVIRETVKPIENIDSIKIVDMGGSNKLINGSLENNNQNSKNFTEQAVDSALRYKLNLPFVNDLLKEVGVGDLNSLQNLGGQQIFEKITNNTPELENKEEIRDIFKTSNEEGHF